MSTNASRNLRGSALSPAVQYEICQANKELDREVRQFMEYVPSAREESLSEFIFWRWRQLDERFNYQIVRPTTAAQEARSGADVLLQLWLVDSARVLPLLIQAKKFLLPHDSYRSKLRYPGGTALQLKRLMATAAQWRFEPCYLIYAGGGNAARPSEWAMHLVDAANIELLAKTPRGPLSLGRILELGSPFHHLFCPPTPERLPEIVNAVLQGEAAWRPRKDVPGYVDLLLARRQAEPTKGIDPGDLYDFGSSDPDEQRPFRVKAVGVYDLSADRHADRQP